MKQPEGMRGVGDGVDLMVNVECLEFPDHLVAPRMESPQRTADKYDRWGGLADVNER